MSAELPPIAREHILTLDLEHSYPEECPAFAGRDVRTALDLLERAEDLGAADVTRLAEQFAARGIEPPSRNELRAQYVSSRVVRSLVETYPATHPEKLSMLAARVFAARASLRAMGRAKTARLMAHPAGLDALGLFAAPLPLYYTTNWMVPSAGLFLLADAIEQGDVGRVEALPAQTGPRPTVSPLTRELFRAIYTVATEAATADPKLRQQMRDGLDNIVDLKDQTTIPMTVSEWMAFLATRTQMDSEENATFAFSHFLSCVRFLEGNKEHLIADGLLEADSEIGGHMISDHLLSAMLSAPVAPPATGRVELTELSYERVRSVARVVWRGVRSGRGHVRTNGAS